MQARLEFVARLGARRCDLGFRTLTRKTAIAGAVGLGFDKAALWRRHWRARHGRPQLVVAEMHETPRCFEEQLRTQLEWAAQNFAAIRPDDLTMFWTQPRNSAKTAILFTFDDGRESNYSVAAPLLESLGMRGIFFVVPEFVGRTAEQARRFFYDQIDIRGLPQSASEEDWKPMSPDQLRDLAGRGHAIGNHTYSHANLRDLSDSELNHEIVESARAIGEWTGKAVDFFAWAYSWDAIDRRAWDLIRRTHRFCFSPCPGTVERTGDSPHLIWRKEVEAYYSAAEYRFMYSGLVDPLWAQRRRRLRMQTASG